VAVSVERGLLSRWRSGTDVLLRVRSPEDPVQLRSALTAAQRDIAALGRAGAGPGAAVGPTYLSPLIAVPDGVLLIVDFGPTPASVVRTVPDLLARHLIEAGIEEARIEAPEQIGDRYSTVTGFAPAARAWLRGPLGVPLGDAPRDAPEYLLDLAVRWVRDARPQLAPLGVIVSAEVALTWPSVASALVPALATRAPVAVVASDFSTAVFAGAVEGKFRGTVPQASLTAGGAGWTSGEIVSAMASQRDLARAHAGAWSGPGSPGHRTLGACWPRTGPIANRRRARA
jgi:hypothetical protein